MIKAVLFDFGGVLTESGRSGFIGDTVAELYGLQPERVDITREHADLRRGVGTADEFFAKLNKKYGGHITKEMFIEKTSESYSPSPEVYKLAESLRAHGVRTGILSNIFAMNADVLRAQGSYDGFDPIILSCDVGYAKPDQEFYDIAVKRLGVEPSEILFIDDQQKCLTPARAMGMKVVPAMNPSQIVKDVKVLILQENGIEL